MKDFHLRRATHWIAISLFLGITGCGGDSGMNGGGDPVATTSVTVGNGSNNVFTPPDILVSTGATVTWTWGGNVGHNVTFASSAVSAPSATQATGTFQVTMPTEAGEYAWPRISPTTPISGCRGSTGGGRRGGC